MSTRLPSLATVARRSQGILAALVAVVALASCASLVAQSPEQRWYAARGEYNVVLRTAVAYANSPGAIPEVVTIMRTVHETEALPVLILGDCLSGIRDIGSPTCSEALSGHDLDGDTTHLTIIALVQELVKIRESLGALVAGVVTEARAPDPLTKGESALIAPRRLES